MATAAKKSSPKKKSVSHKKVTATKKASRGYKTLRVAKPESSFFTFKITRQTIYWTILVAFVIVMQLFILKAQYDAMALTDQLDQQLSSMK